MIVLVPNGFIHVGLTEQPEVTKSPQTFKQRYCEERSIPLESFERDVFRNCLYPHAKWVAFLFEWLNRGHFEDDIRTIYQLGRAVDLQEVKAELRALRNRNHFVRNEWRRWFRIRVSVKRLGQLFQQMTTA